MGHFKNDCKIKRKINNLNISYKLKDMLCDLMLNTSELGSMIKSDDQEVINQLQDTKKNLSQIYSNQEKCIKGNCDY